MPPVRNVVYSPKIPINWDFYKALRGAGNGEVTELHVVGPLKELAPPNEFQPQFGSPRRAYLNQIIANFPDGSRIEVSGRITRKGAFEANEVPPEEATTYLFSIFYPDAGPFNFLIEPREEDLLKNRGVAEAALNDIVSHSENGSLREGFRWFIGSDWPNRKNHDKLVVVKIIDA
ncbi:MAG: hypothetical protein A3B68_05390 [Candidatus Melainabacteria bacterium RIFCSPHIGHO2_02_FULL_34_12]|nr:MAG: hypothetical protein A3B68_05390 [Candidatus Melainabacteria bacterium RIFCSPHIGHO2_02_FULL_34_12]